LKAFGNTIKAIDADLRTNFYDSLKTYADKEKEEMQSLSESNNEVAATTNTVQESAAEVQRPIVNREPKAESGKLSPEKIAALKGWDSLKDSEKQAIVDVVLNADGTLKEVIYDDAAGALVGCPTDEGGCGFKSPKTFCSCPVCGVSFV
jgi:flagellar capping protein FliD